MRAIQLHNFELLNNWFNYLMKENSRAICIIGKGDDGKITVLGTNTFSHEETVKALEGALQGFQAAKQQEKKIIAG